MTPLLASLVTGLVSGGQELHEEGAGATPYLVGGLALVILFAAMLALLIFGKGREHS